MHSQNMLGVVSWDAPLLISGGLKDDHKYFVRVQDDWYTKTGVSKWTNDYLLGTVLVKLRVTSLYLYICSVLYTCACTKAPARYIVAQTNYSCVTTPISLYSVTIYVL